MSGRACDRLLQNAMTPKVRIAGILCVVVAAGCANVAQAPADAMAQEFASTVEPTAASPNQDASAAAGTTQSETRREAAVATAPVAAPARRPLTAANGKSGDETAAVLPAPPLSSPSTATRAAPAAKTREEPSVAPVAATQQKKNAAPTPVLKQLEPPLDMAALKARLRDTNGIGMFTKLALKNQVDDLLKQFRAHYLSAPKTSVAALRQPYDMLVLKVLALIQNSDPSLARSISGSREAIWGMLADPEQFNTIL